MVKTPDARHSEAPPPKFILRYDLNTSGNGALFEVIATDKELRARIEELAANDDLNRDNIKVYDVKKARSVQLGIKITIFK
jgi:TusA-related sulfurtransferase